MTALALRLRKTASLQWPRCALFRMIAGGTLWGMALSGGLLALTYQGCGAVCFADACVTTALSIAAGIVTVGPVTFLSARD